MKYFIRWDSQRVGRSPALLRSSVLVAIICILFAASPTAASQKRDVISVYTTLAPLSWFISAVAGDAASVSVLVPPGADPHVYEPKPGQMAALASARIYFAIGSVSPFEASRLPKIAEQNPSLMTVRLDESLSAEGGHDKSHHDPHIWTSVSSAPKILKNVLNAFVKADPDNASQYKENYITALGQINELDAFLKNKFNKECRGKIFIVYHPAWGHFAEDFGIKQEAVEHEGKEPKISALAELIDTALKKGVKTLLAAPSDPERNARIFAGEIGADIVIIDPLAPDWLANMYSVAEKIYEALK